MTQGVTLAAGHRQRRDDCNQRPKVDLAREVGKNIAEKVVQSGIKTCVFDRGGYRSSLAGRVKALPAKSAKPDLHLNDNDYFIRRQTMS